MTGFEPSSKVDVPKPNGTLRPHESMAESLTESTAESMQENAVTPFQREISAALGDAGNATHLNDRPAEPTALFWDVALGLMGIMSLLVGVVLVFFFAAAGTLVLLLGGLVCAMAFGGAARSHGADG